MFIKRINKIHAPPVNFFKKPLPKVDPKENQPINQGKPLKVFSISIDPHARLIALYCYESDTVYLVSILTLLDYVDSYRAEFPKNHQYSFKTPLKPQLRIQNPHPSLNIFQVKFSHSIQGTQFLILSYYSGLIDIYSVITGKKIDSLDITSQGLHSKEIASPVYNVNLIGHSIFVSTYDGRLLCYQGGEIGPCLKFQDEWVRLAYELVEEDDSDASNVGKEGKRVRKMPLYQDRNNKLRLGHRDISPQKEKEKPKSRQRKSIAIKYEQEQPSVLSESYREYLKLESQKIIPEGTHKKYTLTPCERYLVCRNQEVFVVAHNYVNPFYYSVRSKEKGWRELEGFTFGSKPAINQFWGLAAQSEKEKKRKKEDKFDFLDFFLTSPSILVAVVGNYHYENEILTPKCNVMDQCAISIIKFKRKVKYFKPIVVCKLLDAKQNIVDLVWIGPNILLYQGDTGSLYYLEISPQLMI